MQAFNIEMSLNDFMSGKARGNYAVVMQNPPVLS